MKKLKNKRAFFLPATVLISFILALSAGFIVWSPKAGVDGFLEVTQADPLLVSPELDTEKLDLAIEKLRGNQDKLMSTVGLGDEVVATGFLGTLSKVKTANDIFVSSPNMNNGESLIGTYKESISLYKKDVEMLKRSLLAVFSTEKEQPFVYSGSTTTNKIMIEDLDLMLENTKALEKEVAKRESILKNKSFYLPKIQKPNSNEIPSSFTNAAVKPEIHPGIFPVYLVNSDCFGGNNREEIFSYLSLKNDDNLDIFKPTIANNRYYQKLTDKIDAEKALIDQGVDWRIVTEGNTYRCNNLEYQADLRTLVAFTGEFKDKPLFTEENAKTLGDSVSADAFWQAAKQFEDKILTHNSYYSNEDLSKLARYYEYFYQKNVDKKISEEFRRRYLFINNKESNIDEIISTNFFINDITDRAKVYPFKDAKQLYGTRMSYSFVFLNFSKSVWRLNESPKYVGFYTKNDRFATLGDLKEKYTAEQIKKMDEISYLEIRGY